MEHEINSTKIVDKAKSKKNELDYLLQGIDLNAIGLKIEISNGTKRINKLFYFICLLFSIGILCILILCLHSYKYL